MNTFKELVREADIKANFFSASFSSQLKKTTPPERIKLRKIENYIQIEYDFTTKKEFKNIEIEQLSEYLLDCFQNFKQCTIQTESEHIQVLKNKKNRCKIIRSKQTAQASTRTHNRTKNYIIPDHTPCDFLILLGIMTKEGVVKKAHYKKFKQINRFLEMVDDLYHSYTKNEIHIVDFGCGKSYLTFALYYYFSKVKHINLQITGVDIKKDVIQHCNEIAEKLSYSTLKFVHGFIHDFKTDKPVDFVVTLHACDTATDDAILFSVEQKAEHMMFVPCCQHELNKQLKNKDASMLLKHGIFKDRLTALVTDAMRTHLLELAGYKVQSMEFIDLEHTAKNILLRCSKTSRSSEQITILSEQYKHFRHLFSIQPYLESEMKKRKLVKDKEV